MRIHRGAAVATRVGCWIRCGIVAWVWSWVVTRFGVMVGRIAAIVVVIAIGVVVRIHRWQIMRVMAVVAARRWHRRTEAVVVVAVVAGTVVVAQTRTDLDHHPRLVVVTIPAETQGLEVLESGEAEEISIQLVIRHHRVSP